MKRPFQTVSSRIAFSCPWYRVRQDEIITPDGGRGVYNVVEKEDAVWIVPLTAAGEIVMIYNYRYTVDDWCWELPAGSLEPHHATIEACAHDELRQETGGVAEELIYVSQFYVANGIFNEKGHVFLGLNVTLGETDHEPAEVMQVHRKPVAEALRMARAGEIADGPSALALMLSADHLSSYTQSQRP